MYKVTQLQSLYTFVAFESDIIGHSELGSDDTFNTEILCNDNGCLLSNGYRSVVGVGSYVVRRDTQV